jgi:hypothetical protein
MLGRRARYPILGRGGRIALRLVSTLARRAAHARVRVVALAHAAPAARHAGVPAAALHTLSLAPGAPGSAAHEPVRANFAPIAGPRAAAAIASCHL